MKPGMLVGVIFSLLVVACGGGSGDAPGSGGVTNNEDISAAGPLADDTLARVDVRDEQLLYPYNGQSAFSDILKDCALIESAQDACSLDQLPFIGQSGLGFTRDDIMDRLLVTHDWMAERFETLLSQAPEDMLPLVRFRDEYCDRQHDSALQLLDWNRWNTPRPCLSVDDDLREGQCVNRGRFSIRLRARS